MPSFVSLSMTLVPQLVQGQTQKTSCHDLTLLARMPRASLYISCLVQGKTQKTSKQDFDQDVKHQFKESILFILFVIKMMDMSSESYITADDSFKK